MLLEDMSFHIVLFVKGSDLDKPGYTESVQGISAVRQLCAKLSDVHGCDNLPG